MAFLRLRFSTFPRTAKMQQFELSKNDVKIADAKFSAAASGVLAQ
jgi:hypothetical protein